MVDAAANTAPVGAVTNEQSNTSAQNAATMPGATATSGAARQEGTMARARLPKTSTPLAGIGLVGLFSLLGAATLRFRA
jgi:hypothetical protein